MCKSVAESEGRTDDALCLLTAVREVTGRTPSVTTTTATAIIRASSRRVALSLHLADVDVKIAFQAVREKERTLLLRLDMI